MRPPFRDRLSASSSHACEKAPDFFSDSPTHINTLSAAATSTRPSSLPRGEPDLKVKSMVEITEEKKRLEANKKTKGFLFFFSSFEKKKHLSVRSSSALFDFPSAFRSPPFSHSTWDQSFHALPRLSRRRSLSRGQWPLASFVMIALVQAQF